MVDERKSGVSRFLKTLAHGEVSPFAKALLAVLEQHPHEPAQQPEQPETAPDSDPLQSSMMEREFTLAALAWWRADRDVLVAVLTARRQKLVEHAWKCGLRNISRLAEIAEVSRDTVYADLRASGIDPAADRNSPVESQTPRSQFYVEDDRSPMRVRAIDNVAVHVPCGQRFISYTGDLTDPARKHDDECVASADTDDTDEWVIVSDEHPVRCLWCGDQADLPATHMVECMAYQGPRKDGLAAYGQD